MTVIRNRMQHDISVTLPDRADTFDLPANADVKDVSADDLKALKDNGLCKVWLANGSLVIDPDGDPIPAQDMRPVTNPSQADKNTKSTKTTAVADTEPSTK